MEHQVFHITVKSLIFHQGKFLLMKSDDPEYFGALECPGGRVNRGELIEDTMKRELKEEIGLNLDVTPHEAALFTLNQRDEIEYDWDGSTQIIEVYYKVTVPDDVNLQVNSLQESTELIWIDTATDLDSCLYRVESRKGVYERAQSELFNG